MRLIDADALLKEYDGAEYEINSSAYAKGCNDVVKWSRKTINEQPTIDVVLRSVYDQTVWERDIALMQLKDIDKGLGEKMDDVAKIKYGYWLDDGVWATCSECNKVRLAVHPLHLYCPSCGAKMTGKDNNND